MGTVKETVKNSSGRDAGGRFVSGCSGGPGRPKGSANSVLVQARTWVSEKGLPLMIEAAENGDMDALKALVTLGMPRQKPTNPPLDCLEAMPLPQKESDLGKVACFLVEQVAGGRISVGDAVAVYELSSKAVVAQRLGKPFSIEDLLE